MSESSLQPKLRRAVFLDRDGTLINNSGDLGDPSQLQLLPGVPQALNLLLSHKFKLIVVTNQGGVARGQYDEAAVLRVHEALERMLRQEMTAAQVMSDFYYCPFHPQGTVEHYRREHEWRKPAPGMLLSAAKQHDIDLKISWMVGDQERDVQAGAAAQCRTILLTHDRELAAASSGDFVESDLLHAAKRICAPVIDAITTGCITLNARRDDILNDNAFHQAIKLMAHGLAQRTGIHLMQLHFHTNSITATVEGGDVIALGFVAELRRESERWWKEHRGPESPWGTL